MILNTTTPNLDPPIIVSTNVEKLVIETPKHPWVFQEFPSHFIPYKGKVFFVRPLTVSLLARLHAIRSKSINFSLFLDVLNNCIEGIDIRDLTFPDFQSFLYWLRINSYPKTPLKFEFNSRYLTEPTLIKITMNKEEYKKKAKSPLPIQDKNYYDLEFTELDKTVDWNYYFDKGLRFPTVRDMELMKSNNSLEEEARYLLNYAQYVKADFGTDNYIQSHLDKLNELCGSDLSFLEFIDEFASKIHHGVEQSLHLVANNINLEDYKKKLETRKKLYSDIILTIDDKENVESKDLLVLSSSIDEINKELEKIKDCQEKEELFMPEEEVVKISISLDTFFPLL